jgi:hypothetical protein
MRISKRTNIRGYLGPLHTSQAHFLSYSFYLLITCSLGPIYALPLSLLLPCFPKHRTISKGDHDSPGPSRAQEVSRRLPTAAVRVRTQVRPCGISGAQNGTGVGLLRVLRFPLLILIPSTAPHSSSIFRGWYNRPISGRSTKWTQSHPTPRNLKKKRQPKGW